jgi:hypothetical protein
VEELTQAIKDYLAETNRQPKPFLWTASVQKILEKINRCKAISDTTLDCNIAKIVGIAKLKVELSGMSPV